MYDYAIDKYVPVRFFDYIHQTWSDTKPSTTLEVQEGNYAPPVGLTYLQIGREGLGFQKSQNNGMAIPPPAPVRQRVSSLRIRASPPPIMRRRSSTASILR